MNLLCEFKIVLASTSPRRISLLEQIGLPFTAVEPSGEESSVHPNPRMRVMENASAKARSVQGVRGPGVVVGADTVVYIDGVVLGKPSSREEAGEMLRKIAGRVHKVFTGVAVIDIDSGREVVRCEETMVHIMRLSGDEIARYVDSGEPMGKAGAYAIQGLGAAFVDRVVGCYHNVVGLPLSLLWNMVGDMGYDVFSLWERDNV
ncbi:septum formation inhibitor Maf [Candidatus Bathyarchaeota archaeon]|nr:septum formation inhibitor Maf [Candidatus Bathyarchaeota archaeon]